MPPPPTTTDLRTKLFPSRVAPLFITLALLALILFSGIFFTRLNANPIQKMSLVAFALLAVWQLAWQKSIDILALLLTYLSVFVLFSLHRAEVLSTLQLISLTTGIAVILTLWQGFQRFPKGVLARHVYLVGIMAAEITAFFAYWFIFDDVSAKALLSTFLLYILWGFLEADSHDEFTLQHVKGYLALGLLLTVVVLVTMKPALFGGLH